MDFVIIFILVILATHINYYEHIYKLYKKTKIKNRNKNKNKKQKQKIIIIIDAT